MASETPTQKQLHSHAIGALPCDYCCRQALKRSANLLQGFADALLDPEALKPGSVIAFVPGVREIPREWQAPPKPTVEPAKPIVVTDLAKGLALGFVIVTGYEILGRLREQLALAQASEVLGTLASALLDAANPATPTERRLFNCAECIRDRAFTQRKEQRIWATSKDGKVRVRTRMKQ